MKFTLLLLAAALTGFSAPIEWQTHPGHRFARVTPAQPGKVGFTQITPDQSGIRFTNTLSIQTAAKNQNLLSGAGVAAGDFDGDGLCDLYFCNIEGRNALFRNLGSWKFENVTEKAGVLAPAGMFSFGAMFADMNGDGWLDLLVTGNNGPNALFLNRGNGTFTNVTAAAGLVSKPLGSTSMAAADLDGNGTLDLFVANYGENTVLRSGGEVSVRMMNGKPVVTGRAARRLKIIDSKLIEFGEPSAVYLNDGALHFTPLSWTDGRFRDEDGNPLSQPFMDLSLSVMMRDINGDGAPDIYVCNDFQTPDRIWLNDGRANFRAMPRLAMRSQSVFSMGVDFADMDRDGRLDFVVVDMLSRIHNLRMTQMADTNVAPSAIGFTDDRPQIRRDTMFWNRGDGTYAEIANFAGVAASDWTWTPAFLDVDLDGYEDLLVSNGHAFDTQDMDVSERQMRVTDTSSAVERLRAFPKLETPKYAFRNRGDLTFEEVGEKWGFNSRQVCHGVVFADLDNDGDLDVVLSSLGAPPVVYRNESPAARIAVRLKGKAPNTRGIGAKILVRGGPVPEQMQEMIAGGRYLSSDEPVRMFAAGAATNRLSIEVRWRSGLVSRVRDAEPDCIYEIDEAVAESAPMPHRPVAPPLFKDVSELLAHEHIETAFDDFARQPLLDSKMSQLGPGVAWFDVDGDGREELFVGAGRGGKLAMFRLNERGGFVRADAPGVATDDLIGMAGWVSAPNQRALLVARAGYESGAPAILATGRALNFSEAGAKLLSSPSALAVADYNGDGALDVFVCGRVVPGRYPKAATSQLFQNNNGQLVPDARNAKAFDQLGLATAAVWSDLDGDGWPELLVACEWGALKIFRNNRGALTAWDAPVQPLNSQPSTLNQLTGWWTSITTGDFDGDGRLDIVAGNWGLNSCFAATAQEPARMFFGEVNGDGVMQCIDAEFDPVSRKVVPRENLTTLAPPMPFLRGKFQTYRSLRDVSVSELLGERFAATREVQAKTLASTLFLNRGDHFDAKPLPREAQWTPVFGLCVADADGDGNEDVFLAQNFFATRKDIPRMDAGRGLWLRGDGTGNFIAMPGQESGVIVWGEQRGAAVADYDGDGRVDLAVAQNGAATKLFHNERAKPGLRVRLKGLAVNPDGVGAVVRLKYNTTLGAVREVHAGSGHGSQDSSVPVLGLSGTATHAVVRWPGGRVTETPIAASAKEVVVEFGER